MQDVNQDFEDNSDSDKRSVDQEVRIKWNPDGSFESESNRVLQIVIDRTVKAPLAGTHSAQCTIQLDNHDGRYISED